MWHPDSSQPPAPGTLRTGELCCVGLGNPLRCDDGAGIALVRSLKSLIPVLDTVELSGDAFSLLDLWEKKGDVSYLMADAVSSGAPPGTLHLLGPSLKTFPRHFSSGSTHDFGLAYALQMAGSLGTLPRRIWVVGVEGACFEHGTELSDPVQSGIREAVEEMERWFEIP